MNPPVVRNTAEAKEKLSAAIFLYLEKNHMSLRGLSGKLGLSESYMQKICSQERFPSFHNLLLICREIDFPITLLDPAYAIYSPVHHQFFQFAAGLSPERLAYYLKLFRYMEDTWDEKEQS